MNARRTSGPAFAAAIPALVVLLVLAWCAGALADPDVWWHVRAGRLILDTGSIPHTDPWSFTTQGRRWVLTAWLSDALFGATWKLDGYAGIRLLRILMAAAVVLAVWYLARRTSRNDGRAVWGAALVLLALTPFLRERPQVLSFLFVAWLALRLEQVRRGKVPGLLSAVLVTYAWANVHGMWVLAPLGFVGAGVLAWLDDRTRIKLAARCTAIAGFGALSAALTPVGPQLALWPLVVRRVAAPISEWQPTLPTSGIAVAFVLIIVCVVVRWARAGVPVPPTTIAYVLAVSAFGFTAYRNIAPAAILLLPELVRPGPEETQQTRHLPRLAVPAVVVTGVALAIVRAQFVPLHSSDEPTRILADLRTRPVGTRVLNWYDLGGLITGTASPPVRAAIDGRADIWSRDFVRDYAAGMSGDAVWRDLVTRLRPDLAVLPRDSEVAHGLVEERHWHVTLSQGSWVLLEPTA